MPYMMMPGDDMIVAPRIYAVLSNPPRRTSPAVPGTPGRAGGQWDVEISYKRDHAVHTLFLEQKGDQLMGSHRGEFLSGDIIWNDAGAHLRCRSNPHHEG